VILLDRHAEVTLRARLTEVYFAVQALKQVVNRKLFQADARKLRKLRDLKTFTLFRNSAHRVKVNDKGFDYHGHAWYLVGRVLSLP
jgi:hypothetical protein